MNATANEDIAEGLATAIEVQNEDLDDINTKEGSTNANMMTTPEVNVF